MIHMNMNVAEAQPLSLHVFSDTGIGSCLDEFFDLKLCSEDFGSEYWDGVLSVTTTSISDDEIHNYLLSTRECVSEKSGTEVCLLVSKNLDVLVGEIKCFLQKILVLKIPSVAIELVVEREDTPRSKDEYLFLANEWNPLPFSASNLERLKSGLEEYVLKHGNILNTQCHSCFPNSTLKVGTGMVSQTKSRRNTGLVMEAVIVISEMSDQTSTCFRACSAKTEVLYFKDFSSCTITQSSLKALRSIDWRSYGLELGNVENRVKLALGDLREKHTGVLLSAHALKIRSYAPDLAKTMAGLILSSEDIDFQTECFSLLGLQSQDVGSETVEACINEKIISVIEMNDKKPQRSKDVAPFLFEDDCGFQEPGLEYDEYEGENAFSPMDIYN
ncbi:hypothetical protein CsatB_022217 [Cannabis sativa]